MTSPDRPPPGPPAGPPKASAAAERPPRRWRRRLLWLAAAVLLLVLLAPTLATSGPGRRWLQRRLSSELRLQLELGSIGAWWWSPLTVRDIQITTPSGRPVARLQRLRTGKTLLGMIGGGVDKGELLLERPDVSLELNPRAIGELADALKKIDPASGLLSRLAPPNRDSISTLKIVDGAARVRPEGQDWQRILHAANASVRIEKTGGDVVVDVAPGEICHLDVSPPLCDLGLEYVLPVLTGALEAGGECHLSLDHCHLDFRRVEACEASGQLVVESIRAEVEGPLLRQVGSLVADLVQRPDLPMSVQLADNCAVDFAVAEGVVSHQGLKFGLPKVLPELVLQTRGDIAFDRSLDLLVEAQIPFNKIGEAEVLQRLGSPRLAVPVTGTLSAPQLQLGEGQLAKGLVGDLVRSLTDDQIDPAPLLEQIGNLGLLQRRRQRQAQDASGETGGEADGGEAPAVTGEEPDGEQQAGRRRLLERLRQRGGLFRRKRESTDE